MNKELYDKFIEAEKLWEEKIKEVYDIYFNQNKEDYKKIAKLLIVIKNRVDYYLEDEKLSYFYLILEGNITSRSNENLDEEDYDNFCKLADNYSIIKESQN